MIHFEQLQGDLQEAMLKAKMPAGEEEEPARQVERKRKSALCS